jgi:hypothetical protein
MKIPEKIERNRKTYRLVKQVNKKLFLYEQEGTGFKECFSLYDLGLTPKRKTEYKLKPERVIFI